MLLWVDEFGAALDVTMCVRMYWSGKVPDANVYGTGSGTPPELDADNDAWSGMCSDAGCYGAGSGATPDVNTYDAGSVTVPEVRRYTGPAQ